MKGLQLLLLIGIVLGLQVSPCAKQLRAQSPTYLLLQPPPAPSNRHAHSPPSPTMQTPAIGVIVPAQPYAYGWFGARPRRQWSRHFGYYRNYTQWSAR